MKYMLEQDTDNSGTLDFEEFKVPARDAFINIFILLILYYITLYWALLTIAEYAVHRGVHKLRFFLISCRLRSRLHKRN